MGDLAQGGGGFTHTHNSAVWPFANLNLIQCRESTAFNLQIMDVEFLRAQGSQSGVSVWQHTLVG